MNQKVARSSLESALAASGLRLLGGWLPGPDERGLPILPGGVAPAVVWMVGQVGSQCWPVFSASVFYGDGLPDPMDRWSKSIGGALAGELGGAAVYPSDGPPYAPFQQWARRAAPLQPSPLRLQIHPQWGLWHAYRFALVLPELPAADAQRLSAGVLPANPVWCLACDGQPCLSSCPVDAFSAGGYDVGACAGHLQQSPQGDCMQRGCMARRACPVARELQYEPAHAAFHMAAFAGRR